MTKTNIQSVVFASIVLLFILMRGSGGRAKTPVVASGNNERAAADISKAFVLPPQKESFLSLPASIPAISSPHDESLRAELTPERGVLNEGPSNIDATAAIVAEVGSPYALYKKNSALIWPIASLSKLMTALVTREHMDRARAITMSETAIQSEGEAGGFRTGERYTVEDLIHAMLLVSSNDAATALAEAYGTPEFLELMRVKAGEIGMTATSFIDPSGLSPGNRSTVEDLERLSGYLLEHHPDLFAVSALPTSSLTELITGSVKELKNINFFAGTAGFLGGKTGFTNEASGNLLSLFEIGGKKFLIIVFGTKDRFKETQKLFNWVSSKL